MRIALLCATRRGCLLLEKLSVLSPEAELVVFSFRETPWEPPFLDDIRRLTLDKGGLFQEARRVDDPEFVPFWESISIDLMLAVSWRYMIPAQVYRKPRMGTFVFHDSLLPEYRGFAPTVWAIINGEGCTGVTLFEIAEDVDSGDIVDQEEVPIGPDDKIGDVMPRVTQAYLTLLERNLNDLMNGTAPRQPQDHSRATYTCKWLPKDCEINWAMPSEGIYNLIRAVSAPYPGAYTYLAGRKVRVWEAQRLSGGRRYVGRVPGRVAEVRPGEGVVILTGDGSLLLTRLQLEDDEIVCASELIASVSQTLGKATAD